MAYGEKKSPETIERLRSYADKPINPDKPLTFKEKKFLELIVIHNKEPWKAYDEVYTAKKENRTKQCCQTKAKQTLKEVKAVNISHFSFDTGVFPLYCIGSLKIIVLLFSLKIVSLFKSF